MFPFQQHQTHAFPPTPQVPMFPFPQPNQQFALPHQMQPHQTAEDRELERLKEEAAAEEARDRARRWARDQRIAELEARRHARNT